MGLSEVVGLGYIVLANYSHQHEEVFMHGSTYDTQELIESFGSFEVNCILMLYH